MYGSVILLVIFAKYVHGFIAVVAVSVILYICCDLAVCINMETEFWEVLAC